MNISFFLSIATEIITCCRRVYLPGHRERLVVPKEGRLISVLQGDGLLLPPELRVDDGLVRHFRELPDVVRELLERLVLEDLREPGDHGVVVVREDHELPEVALEGACLGGVLLGLVEGVLALVLLGLLLQLLQGRVAAEEEVAGLGVLVHQVVREGDHDEERRGGQGERDPREALEEGGDGVHRNVPRDQELLGREEELVPVLGGQNFGRHESVKLGIKFREVTIKMKYKL